MKMLRTRQQRTRPASLQVESLEGKALLSGFRHVPSAAQFFAFDQLNLERLANTQALRQLQIVNEGQTAQVVADGAIQTQNILAGGNVLGFPFFNGAALHQVRNLMKQGQHIGTRVDNGLNGATRVLNQIVNHHHQALINGANPAFVLNHGLNALDNVVFRAQAATNFTGAILGQIDNQILNVGAGFPFVPIVPIVPVG